MAGRAREGRGGGGGKVNTVEPLGQGCLAKTTPAQWRKGVEWGRREEISWRSTYVELTGEGCETGLAVDAWEDVQSELLRSLDDDLLSVGVPTDHRLVLWSFEETVQGKRKQKESKSNEHRRGKIPIPTGRGGAQKSSTGGTQQLTHRAW